MFTRNTQRNGGSAGTSNPNNCSAVAGMLLGVCLVFTTPLAADTIYVDDDAPAGGDGASWNSAFRFLQDGIAASQQGDTIRIAQGVYKPDRSEAAPNGTGDREASFHIVSDTIIEGGYAGLGAPDPDVRDVEQFETIFSGDLNGDDEEGFINYEDNSYTVVNMSNATWITTLDGCVITAGNADLVTKEPSEYYLGGGLYSQYGEAVISHCTFRFNKADYGGGLYWRESDYVQIDNCSFVGNYTEVRGAGLRLYEIDFVSIEQTSAQLNSSSTGAGAALLYCSIVHISEFVADSNNTVGPGAGMSLDYCDSITIRSSEIIDNESFAGGAGIAISNTPDSHIIDCRIENNHTDVAGGGCLLITSNCEFINTRIIRNSSGFMGGGVVGQGDIHFTNCLIAQNEASRGGGVELAAASNVNPTFKNTTIAHNTGSGINNTLISSTVSVENCILWANTPLQFSNEKSPPPAAGDPFNVSYSNVQNGWPGPGNIHADPLFVQPGMLNYGLAYGSPCLNAANNANLPPDSFDLDGDGDLTEPLPIDLVGNPRIIDEIVDMGALEGASEMLPPAAGDFDFDAGELAFLIPSVNPFDPLQHSAAIVGNNSGGDNETVIFTDLSDSSNGESGSGSNIHLLLETSLNDGEISAYLYAPITAADLDPEDPLGADLVIIDPASGDRLLATALNVENNSHTGEPIGRRFVSTDAEDWQNTFTIGDYGIVWDEITQQGFVWANVDVAGEFQLRQSTCPGDCFPSGGNEAVNLADLLELLGFFSYEHRWCDFNDDGIVDAADLTILLEHWGMCSP